MVLYKMSVFCQFKFKDYGHRRTLFYYRAKWKNLLRNYKYSKIATSTEYVFNNLIRVTFHTMCVCHDDQKSKTSATIWENSSFFYVDQKCMLVYLTWHSLIMGIWIKTPTLLEHKCALITRWACIVEHRFVCHNIYCICIIFICFVIQILEF